LVCPSTVTLRRWWKRNNTSASSSIDIPCSPQGHTSVPTFSTLQPSPLFLSTPFSRLLFASSILTPFADVSGQGYPRTGRNPIPGYLFPSYTPEHPSSSLFFGIYIIIHTLTHRIFALHQRTSLNARLTLLDGLISLPLPIFSLFLLIPKQPGYSRALHSPPSPFLPPFKPRCKLGSQCVHYLESPWPKRCYFFISLIYWWSAYS